ncbi:MAG: hypothetical protein ACK5XU_11240 [Pseudomonadota bacterium]
MPTQLVAGALSLLLVQAASAQALADYRCTIDRIQTAPNLPGPSRQFLESTYLGKAFTVDRRTGVTSGAVKNNVVVAPVVLDSGDKDSAFKSVALMPREKGAGASSNVYTLVINEFEAGRAKPFAYLHNATVYFGQCMHF